MEEHNYIADLTNTGQGKNQLNKDKFALDYHPENLFIRMMIFIVFNSETVFIHHR